MTSITGNFPEGNDDSHRGPKVAQCDNDLETACGIAAVVTALQTTQMGMDDRVPRLVARVQPSLKTLVIPQNTTYIDHSASQALCLISHTRGVAVRRDVVLDESSSLKSYMPEYQSDNVPPSTLDCMNCDTHCKGNCTSFPSRLSVSGQVIISNMVYLAAFYSRDRNSDKLSTGMKRTP